MTNINRQNLLHIGIALVLTIVALFIVSSFLGTTVWQYNGMMILYVFLASIFLGWQKRYCVLVGQTIVLIMIARWFSASLHEPGGPGPSIIEGSMFFIIPRLPLRISLISIPYVAYYIGNYITKCHQP